MPTVFVARSLHLCSRDEAVPVTSCVLVGSLLSKIWKLAAAFAGSVAEEDACEAGIMMFILQATAADDKTASSASLVVCLLETASHVMYKMASVFWLFRRHCREWKTQMEYLCFSIEHAFRHCKLNLLFIG